MVVHTLHYRWLVLICAVVGGARCQADVFTVREDDGNEKTVEARVYGETRGVIMLQRDDGRIEFVPDAAVVTREPGAGPEPATPEEVAQRLEKRFTPELCRTRVAGNHVVVVKLQAPIDRVAEGRVKRFFDKVQQFVLNLGRNFEQWAKSMDLPADEPEFPLVMVIFETDADFEKYASEATSGGLSVQNLSGFYSHNTNWLAVRSDECDSYVLPLHEGIHQQVYNRGWYKRFAPVPVWFDEGIATGFENDGDRLRGDPSKVNRMYATRSAGDMALSFPDVIESDAGFRGDVVAGDAYTRAWALHWLLANERKDEYVKFVNELGTLEPLQIIEKSDRLDRFHENFELAPNDVQKLYEVELDKAARRQRVKPIGRGPAGITTQQDQSGLVTVKALLRPEGLTTQGKLRNISPFRELAFRVRVLTDGSPPVVWVLPNVRSQQLVDLEFRQMPFAPKTFRVEVRSALPSSPEALGWTAGTERSNGRR